MSALRLAEATAPTRILKSGVLPIETTSGGARDLVVILERLNHGEVPCSIGGRGSRQRADPSL